MIQPRCPGCGFYAATGGLCGSCLRDQDLGERLGTSRSEDDEWAHEMIDDQYYEDERGGE